MADLSYFRKDRYLYSIMFCSVSVIRIPFISKYICLLCLFHLIKSLVKSTLYDLTIMKTFFKVFWVDFFTFKKPTKVIVFCLIECLLRETLCPTIIISCLTVFLSYQTFCLIPEKKYFKPWLVIKFHNEKKVIFVCLVLPEKFG